MSDEIKKFEKVLILTNFSMEAIQQATIMLLHYMDKSNQKENLKTQFMNLRLKYPERDIVGDVRELKLEWAAL